MSLEWRGAAVDPGHDVPSATTWRDVEVPGRPAQFAGEDAVAYRTEFHDPRVDDDEHVVLGMNGVYAHARVWLNGEAIATHDTYFDPIRVSLPVTDENELVVECRAPEDRFGGIYDTDRVPQSDRVPGIWWEATIETHPDPFIESLDVEPRVSENGKNATVAAHATVVTNEPLDDRITFSVRPAGDVHGGGMMNRATVETGPGRTTVTQDVEVRDASLWWPHDVGQQSRYALRANLDGTERTTVTGLKTVEYDDNGLVVNGQRVAAHGINLVDAEPGDVTRAKRANANLVRAHAHVLSPEVYEACDEHGLFVWQDLPLTGPGEFDVERGRDLAKRLVRGRRGRPSLAAVSVHDEPVEDFGAGLGSGIVDRLRYRFRAWRASYDHDPAETVTDPVTEVPTFPVVGPAGIDPDAATLSPGWTFGNITDVDWLCEHYQLGDVVAEFGAPALANDDGATDRSQASQAAVVGQMAEALRLRDSNLLVASGLKDVGNAGVEPFDREGNETTVFDHLAMAYQPVQAMLVDPSPGERPVVVLNDRPTAATLTVEWDVNGERDQTEVDAGPYGRVDVTTLSVASGDDLTLAVAVDGTVTHNEYHL